MSSAYENRMFRGSSGEVSSRFEPRNAGRVINGSQHVNNRFHPYSGVSMSGQRAAYESYYTSEYFPEICHNVFMPPEGSNYLSGSVPNLTTGTYLPLYYYGNQQTNYQGAFMQRSIQNLCKLNADIGNTTGASSSPRSVIGKDRSHPFYSRKRVEPAEGMTRTRDKYRVVYTEKQRRGLEKEYNTNKFITTEIRAKISEDLGLSVRQIKIWFQNRRAKERRDSRKDEYKHEEKESAEEGGSTSERSFSSPGETNKFFTSCRFTGNDNISDKIQQSSGQCQISKQTETRDNCVNSALFSVPCFLDSRNNQSTPPTISPSLWGIPAGNGFMQTVDVSPLIGVANFDTEQLRL